MTAQGTIHDELVDELRKLVESERSALFRKLDEAQARVEAAVNQDGDTASDVAAQTREAIEQSKLRADQVYEKMTAFIERQ